MRFFVRGRSAAAADVTTRFPTSPRVSKAWLVRGDVSDMAHEF
jgi:hypothetical protein